MLHKLRIKNYALIRDLEMQPSKGLTMITGETGAGKSIMLGAVGLLLGKRADTSVLLQKDQKCVVEGEFIIADYNLEGWFSEHELDYEEPCIIRREINPQGKSRAFINDTPVNLATLQDLGVRLMDIHSQHETLQLGSHRFQREFIDAFAGNKDLIEKYRSSYRGFRSVEKQLHELESESAKIEQEADYNRFLLEELTDADLDSSEQEMLEEEQKIAENSEEIKAKLNELLAVLRNSDYSVEGGLQNADMTAVQIARLAPRYDTIKARLSSINIELSDIISEIENEEESVQYDPEKAIEIQERLSLIYQLQTKHKVSTIADLLSIQQKLSEKVLRSQNLDNELEKLRKAKEEAFSSMLEVGKKLSQQRSKSINPIEEYLQSLLAELGMPNATTKVLIEEKEPSGDGLDQIGILFSANKGVSPEELSKVASGGEFTRLMFAIKYIMAEKVALPTLIFDEIDTGVSGEVANKLGVLMQELSKRHQVIAISHLPQVAARGVQHFFVYKDEAEDITVSKIKELTDDARILEIAKMIGGESPSESALQNAREMVNS